VTAMAQLGARVPGRAPGRRSFPAAAGTAIAPDATAMPTAGNAGGRTARRRRERGQGLVELGMLLPLVAFLWMTMVDVGRGNVKRQQAFKALDAVVMMITNQPTGMSEADLEAFGCDVLAKSNALADMNKSVADCTAEHWVDVQEKIPDTSSSTGEHVYPVVVTLPVKALLPFTFKLVGGTTLANRADYTVSTGVRYVRSSLMGQ